MRCEKRYGTVLKRETIGMAQGLNNGGILVLQSKDPYPGYFCPEKSSRRSCKGGTFFLPHALPLSCPDDQICRISLQAVEQLGINTCLAFITIRGKLTRAFRLKETPAEKVAGAAAFFQSAGIAIQPERHVPTHLSQIFIKSFQCLTPLDSHIFRNSQLSNHYYLTVPAQLDWDLFERLITYQKNTAEIKNFDAAIGYWIQSPQFADFIRIYGPRLTHQQLLQIRSNFIDTYNKYINKEIII